MTRATATRLPEPIPAVTEPVKLPRLVSSDARLVVGVAVGAVALSVCLSVFALALALAVR